MLRALLVLACTPGVAVPAVTVEQVEPGGAAARAGLQVGDVLLAWETPSTGRTPSLLVSGLLGSPAAFRRLELERAPLGAVRLVLLREGVERRVEVPAGRWKVSARPALAARALARYEEGRRAMAAGELDRGLARWRRIADHAAAAGDPGTASWMLSQTAARLSAAGRLEEALPVADAGREEAGWAGDSGLAVAAEETLAAILSEVGRAGEATEARVAQLDARLGLDGGGALVAESLKKLGNLVQDRGMPVQAGEIYRRFLAVAARYGGGSLVEADALNNLAILARSRGHLDAAESLHRRALAIGERLAPGGAEVVASLNNLALVAEDRGELDVAEDSYRRALAIQEILDPGSLVAATILNNLGNVAWSRADPHRAEDLHRAALALRERLAPGGLEHGQSLNNLGNLARQLGDLPAARAYVEEALAIQQRLAPESLSTATVLMNLGIVDHLRGHLVSAERSYRASLAMRERLAPDGPAVAASLTTLGLLAWSRHELAAAEVFYRRALDTYQRLAPGSIAVGMTLNNLGILAQQQGLLERAEELFTGSLDVESTIASRSLGVAASLANLGQVAVERGDLARAEELHRRALVLRRELVPGGLEVAESLLYLAAIVVERGDLDEPEQAVQEALTIYHRLAPGSAKEAMALQDMGLVLRAGGRLDQALGYFRRAVESFESQRANLGGSDIVKARFAERHKSIYQDYMEALLAAGAGAAAVEVLECSRARGLLALLRERDLVFAEDLPGGLDRERRLVDAEWERVQAALATVAPVAQPERADELLQRLEELRAERDEVEERVRAASPRLASLHMPEPLSLERARAVLDPGTLWLAYTVGEERTVLLAVGPGPEDLAAHVLPFGHEVLAREVRGLRDLIERRANEGVVSAALGEVLLGEVTAELAAAERVLISPDGPLNFVPFAALGLPGSDARVVDTRPSHVVVSVTVYALLREGRSGRREPRLVAFGDPAYPAPEEIPRARPSPTLRLLGRDLGDLTPLPSTRDEVLGIAALEPEATTVWLGPEATEERASSLSREVTMVHFACHGVVADRLPLESALILAMPGGGDGGSHDGLLQAWEVFERVRLDADLVVLSACDTALGEEMGGEGIVGLTRAFQYAGARAIVASLWSVADASTAALMQRFYAGLEHGASKDVALQRAQLELRRGPIQVREGERVDSVDASHPFHWAPFVLIGDWR